jgi:proteasome lid subunit RPN8/RPN11
VSPVAKAVLPAAVRRAIIAHAKRDAPNECCGLLIGRGNRLMFSLPMANVDPRPTAGFRVDPAEHVAARRVLRHLSPSLEIVGVYHSHPKGPPTPSPRDIVESNYPEWIFVIVGGKPNTVRAFRIRRHAATRVVLIAAPSQSRRRRAR